MPGKPPARTSKAVDVASGSTTSDPLRDTDSEVAVVIDGVSKHFGSVHALQSLNAHIRYGCLTGLVGPDGAGKTTLMRILTGLLAPNSGQATEPLDFVAVQERCLKAWEAIVRAQSYVPGAFSRPIAR